MPIHENLHRNYFFNKSDGRHVNCNRPTTTLTVQLPLWVDLPNSIQASTEHNATA